jgi:hypothetical protein
LRVSYYSIGGHALDFLIRGQLDKKWEATLGGQSYIVPNETFYYLKGLVERFSVPFDRVFFTTDPDFGSPDEASASQYQGKPLFIGGWRVLFFESALRDIDVHSLLDSSSAWNIQLTDHPLLPVKPFLYRDSALSSDPTAFYFWRFLERGDLDRLVGKLFPNDARMRFYKHITREFFPPDFGIISLQYSDCGQTAALDLTSRYPRLLVAVMENLSTAPLRIGAAVTRKVKVERMRTGSEDDQLLNDARTQRKNLFPPQLLGPKEKVLIPLRLSMVYDDLDFQFLPDLREPTRATPDNVPDAISLPVYMNGGSEELLSIPRETFIEYLHKARPSPAAEKEYVLGPSFHVESIDINDALMPIRPFDPKILIIKAGSYTGSCPYVFSYSPEHKGWVSEGHILYGFDSKNKERSDRKHIRRFDGRLLIREHDAETSFIDQMRVEIACAGGQSSILLPKDPLLRKADGRYLKLNQGDEVLVTFEGRVPRGCEATLESFGYYQPYR